MSLPSASGGPVIEITVDPQGNTRVATKGFTGASCRAASRFLEEALGRSTGERLTAEFYHQATTEQQLRHLQ
ncbi:DUF2997 domain-containing protein [Tautonia marina]|uniref:DUF2997 domain-containing protein n=1 Tax=Tautonia marina TaxID=2653855 RepID=UPI0012604981|nr:DUF2997 domain-containing protein [Tautonia marina]